LDHCTTTKEPGKRIPAWQRIPAWSASLPFLSGAPLCPLRALRRRMRGQRRQAGCQRRRRCRCELAVRRGLPREGPRAGRPDSGARPDTAGIGGGARRSSGGCLHGSERPMYFSISGMTKDSSSQANETAVPACPARPVRPIL
jgi:hypothetical protein